MIRFSTRYFLLSLLILAIEIFIGARLDDNIIRPYGGDYLVVMLLYCMVRTCLNTPVVPTAVSALLFAYLIEFLQYEKLADHLHLRPGSLARIMLGDYFTWKDIIAYTLGIASVIAMEKWLSHKPKPSYHE
jgi:hypothetical protein